MEKMIFETEVVETKNNYTVSDTIEKVWSVKKPIMKKTLYGVEIKKPTSYRIYQSEMGSRRTWVFGDLEINPSRFNLNQIAK
jgi:hypothetical protein